MKYGALQGSVIGPVLFLVTVNDLDQLGDLLSFAGDTTIVQVEAHRHFGRGKTWSLESK